MSESVFSNLAEQVTGYLVAVEPGYSKATVATYRGSLRRLETYCAECGISTVAELGEDELGMFHEWLWGSRFSPSTVAMTLRSAKLFLKWSHRSGCCLWDGGSYLVPEPRSSSPQPPTVAVMKRLLELPDCGTVRGLRDLFALELLYVLGLRRAECCALDLEALDLGAETLFVAGKNGDERLLPVGPTLERTAWRYLRVSRPQLLPAAGEKALVLGNEGQRLTFSGLAYIAKKYGARLGLRLSPHHYRHACATHLVEAGMELEQIQRLLGHRRIDSTERYAKILGREVRREFVRSHPRARASRPVRD